MKVFHMEEIAHKILDLQIIYTTLIITDLTLARFLNLLIFRMRILLVNQVIKD